MRTLLLTLTNLFICLVLLADAPQKIGYQAIIRDSTGQLLQSQVIDVRVTILQGGTGGSPVYFEEHSPTTNDNGLVSFEIGNGINILGNLSQINWSSDNFFVTVETDIYGQGTYDIVASSELISVPYALHSQTADSIIGGINELDPKFSQSPAAGLNQNDVVNVKQLNGVNGLTMDSVVVIPRIAVGGQTLSVTFSAGDHLNFAQASQASATSVMLLYQQGTSASYINSVAAHWFNNKRVDAVFNIPWNAATGTYDVIINPTATQPTWLDKFFEIF
ncbi:MAG: hypothetical protein MRY83_23110 [Flavobacteriales bacterium]|nr:hypothetical protein [Flavobacteriales bacterium]